MKNTLLTFLFILPLLINAQNNLVNLGDLSYNNSLNDVWGYADTAGNEYALVGVYNGFSIVDVTNPAQPNELFFLSGSRSVWRDIKTWNGYAFVVHDGGPDQGMGLQVVNLNYLPDSVPNFTTDLGVGLEEAHNIFIDENGVAYIVGGNVANGGAVFVDVDTDPENPTIVGAYNTRYVHDIYVRGDTMWSAEINDGVFSVVDISNKANPQIMAVNASPGDFAHNLWLSDDGTNLLTTDEIDDGVIGSYDVSNLNNITYIDEYQSSPGDDVTPHNVFIKNDFAIISYYKDGVVILDKTMPNNLIEVGNYDTSPLSGAGTEGCWGVYPYLPSGNILATDRQEGLFVLGVTYQKGCYLVGEATDIVTTFPVAQVNVEITSNIATTQGNLQGEYQLGVLDSGTFTVTFTAQGYLSKTVHGVVLRNGIVTTLDVELTPAIPLTITGVIVDSVSGLGIEGADVFFENSLYSYSATTNANGVFTVNNIYNDTYTMFAGKWGHVTGSKQITIVNANTTPELELVVGYYDDFLFDNNWTVTGNAVSGVWEKAVPIGTSYNGLVSNVDADYGFDYGAEAFVTGNDGGSAGNDDVDDGITVLSSPLFDLEDYDNPKLQLHYWFFNDGGNGTPIDDELVIRIKNKDTTVVVNSIVQTTYNWEPFTFKITDYMPATDSMQLIVEVGDQANSGHLVEAGIDNFSIIDSSIGNIIDTNVVDTNVVINVLDNLNKVELNVYPNPFSNNVIINIPDNQIGQKLLFYNSMGKLIDSQWIDRNRLEWGAGLPAGIYLMRITNQNNTNKTVRLIKTE